MSIGLWVGIPLAIASAVVIMYVVRALLQAADKPGLSPTVISVTLLVGLMLLLYAAKPDELSALGDLVGVGLGGLVGILVGGKVEVPAKPTGPDGTEDLLSRIDPEGVVDDDQKPDLEQ